MHLGKKDYSLKPSEYSVDKQLMLASNPCCRADEQQKVAFVKCQGKKHHKISEKRLITMRAELSSVNENGNRVEIPREWED